MGANVQQLYENDERLGNILLFSMKMPENNAINTWQDFLKMMKSFLKKPLMFLKIRLDEFINGSWRTNEFPLTHFPVCQSEFFVSFSTLYIHESWCFNPSPPSPIVIQCEAKLFHNRHSIERWIGWRVWEQICMYYVLEINLVSYTKKHLDFFHKSE